ncbi:helix-turn-helix domain-containing protein [Caenibius sp. WL]|uniref:helix-turn-helix domain-containing protein n=1 Tax=Caenibius sp. WL TaxID=2872646 RepID=UPI001C992D73|nr:helix-turn-helix domain-containing protein [Caenibius sp. WL]QZP08097.1 helix-turn-helix domain-containing protein [Caenibius sp. WL]
MIQRRNPSVRPRQATARKARSRKSSARPLWPSYRRLPAFVPVPVRARRDGWDAVRQGQFIGWLAQTGSVSEAAARVGRSRESAYRLRRRADAAGFAAAWDAALAGRAGIRIPARKVTPDDLPALAFAGRCWCECIAGALLRSAASPAIPRCCGCSRSMTGLCAGMIGVCGGDGAGAALSGHSASTCGVGESEGQTHPRSS